MPKTLMIAGCGDVGSRRNLNHLHRFDRLRGGSSARADRAHNDREHGGRTKQRRQAFPPGEKRPPEQGGPTLKLSAFQAQGRHTRALPRCAVTLTDS